MIPITFNKDDANNLKKGNIRGQDLASYLSISMPKVAGILDIFTNPVSVTNNVISSGYTTLTLNKGYVNIYGRCIYVEQGEQVQVRLPTSGIINGIFGIRVNLGQTGSNEVEWFTSTTNLQQENLLNNEIDGIYEFGIYRYTATNNSFTLGEKIAPIVQNINDYMQGSNFITQPLNDSSNKIATTQFVSNAIQPVIESVNNQLLGEETILFNSNQSLYREVTFESIDNYKFIEILTSNGSDKYWDTTMMSVPRIKNEFQYNGRIRISYNSNNYVQFKSTTRAFVSFNDGYIYIIGIK